MPWLPVLLMLQVLEHKLVSCLLLADVNRARDCQYGTCLGFALALNMCVSPSCGSCLCYYSEKRKRPIRAPVPVIYAEHNPQENL
jgi:hypothetical protein